MDIVIGNALSFLRLEYKDLPYFQDPHGFTFSYYYINRHSYKPTFMIVRVWYVVLIKEQKLCVS